MKRMKIINSVLSFIFGLWLIFALITTVLKFQRDLTNLNWQSIESYGIIILFIVFGFYCLKNILVPFQKNTMKKRGRIIMITIHVIFLFIIFIFSLNQYKYMNPINIIINNLMILTILYLTFYQIKSLNVRHQRD
jgi:hypothetical protein